MHSCFTICISVNVTSCRRSRNLCYRICLHKDTTGKMKIGSVANDRTMPVLKLYFSGVYTEEEAIKRLLPQKLKDQYAFKTERAISVLTFKEVKVL